ncbi:hypothetical protein [Streptomyces sp. NBC_00073]|uniref:hypothetical protein n=1 Tax=Streptomyces sp. NBC_00073 TaxID=2975640 RepID=UPI00324FE9F1
MRHPYHARGSGGILQGPHLARGQEPAPEQFEEARELIEKEGPQVVERYLP